MSQLLEKLGYIFMAIILSGCTGIPLSEVKEKEIKKTIPPEIAVISLEVQGTDIISLKTKIPITTGEVEVKVPSGLNRTFIVEAYSRTGKVLYRGYKILDIQQNRPLNIEIFLTRGAVILKEGEKTEIAKGEPPTSPKILEKKELERLKSQTMVKEPETLKPVEKELIPKPPISLPPQEVSQKPLPLPKSPHVIFRSKETIEPPSVRPLTQVTVKVIFG